MQFANDTTSNFNSDSDSGSSSYTDLETVRKRLIELEKNRIFSDEDLTMLLRKNAHTNLKGGIESRTLSRRSRASSCSERTSSGRAVIRSWVPSAFEDAESEAIEDDEAGWKQFAPAQPVARQPIARQPVAPPVRVEPAFVGRNLKRPNRLKRMQNRNIIVTILANIIFIPKQAVCSLVNMVVPTAGRRAC
jgi:hypothetical protein